MRPPYETERQPEYPWLYSLQGYRYCDLLLWQAEAEDGAGLDGLASDPEKAWQFKEACEEVRKRGEWMLEGAKAQHFLLDIALGHLILGRAFLGLALTATGEESAPEFAQSVEHLDRAVEGLHAGYEDYLARGLLDRAAFHRLRGNLIAAEADLSEAKEIAERGAMRLHLCDVHLEWARLHLQQENAEATRPHVVAARKLVEETGYRRREREIRYLEKRLP